jgi:IclR family pca regulon transcriptional regulator
MTTMAPIRGGILQRKAHRDARYSQSLERGLAILKAFTPDRPWMGIAEIAEELEMSRPTTHRYASTLVALDYLEQGPGRKYRLGMRASDPGRSAVNSTPLAKLPREYLADLRDRSACTTSLVMLDGSDIVYIDRARSSSPGLSEISARLGSGSRLPASWAAAGRLLLAYLSPVEQRRAIDANAEHPASPESAVQPIDELEGIREKGFAIADQLHVEGQQCVAVPLRSSSSEVVGAVEAATAKTSMSQAQTLARLLPLLIAGAERMSAHLGYTPSG